MHFVPHFSWQESTTLFASESTSQAPAAFSFAAAIFNPEILSAVGMSILSPFQLRTAMFVLETNSGWWLSHPSKRYESVGMLIPYGKIKHVRNHQPELYYPVCTSAATQTTRSGMARDAFWASANESKGTEANKCPANRAICAMSIAEWKDLILTQDRTRLHALGSVSARFSMVVAIGYNLTIPN